MGELDEKQLIEKAVEYLQPVKLIECDAINRIDALDEKLGAIILRYEFVLNNTTEDAYKMIGCYSTKQAKRYKQKALLEFGQKLVL